MLCGGGIIKEKILAIIAVSLVLSVSLGMCIPGESEATQSADYSVDLSSGNMYILSPISLDSTEFSVECTLNANDDASAVSAPSGTNFKKYTPAFSTSGGATVSNMTADITSRDAGNNKVTISFTVNGSLSADERYQAKVGSKSFYFVTAGSVSQIVDAADLASPINIDLRGGDIQYIWVKGLSVGTDYTPNSNLDWVSAMGTINTKWSGLYYVKLDLQNVETGAYSFTLNDGETPYTVTLNVTDSSQPQALPDYSVDLSSGNMYILSPISLDSTEFSVECTLNANDDASAVSAPSGTNFKKYTPAFSTSGGATVSNMTADITSRDAGNNKVTISFTVNGSLSADERYQAKVGSKSFYFVTAGSVSQIVDAADLASPINIDLRGGDIQYIWVKGLSVGTDYTPNSNLDWVSAMGTINTKWSGLYYVKLDLQNVETGAYSFTLNDGETPYTVTLNVTDSSQPQVVKHHVTYVLNEGSGIAPTQADVAEGGTFTVASYDGTKDGFMFGGWNDGTNTYNAGVAYTMGTSDVTLTAVWVAVPVSFNYEVIGNSAAIAYEIPISVNSYTVKWSNTMGVNTTGGTVDASSITVKINGTISSDVDVLIYRATGTIGYATVYLIVNEQLPVASVITISVDNQTGHLFSMGSVASLTVYVAGYSEGIVDLSGEATNPLELDATICSTGVHYITIRGINTVPTEMTCAGIVFNIPEDDTVSKTVNNGFVQIPITTDNGTLTNGLHEVTVVVGNATYRFNVNIVNGVSPTASHDQDYVLSVQYNGTVSDSANAVLDIGIQKSANAANLEDMRLLVIAKYSGQYYVFNFYSKPVMDGNTGTDRIVLSKQDLSCVIVEVVDGIQTLDVTFYGVGTYMV
ncbi:adhesin-like protein [methanogenic archaeon ISO4-H5]|nr:adhesin-like protein [methanogenic archaeon ISO4-H5]